MTRSIPSLAAQIYDKDKGTHTEAELAYLDAIWAADKSWTDALTSANLQYGGGSVAWDAVKRLATRQRDADYARALATFEARDDEEILQAAAE